MSVNLSEHGLTAGIHSIKIQGCVIIENDSENDSYMIDSEKVEFFYILPAEKINEKSKNLEIHNDDIRVENEKKNANENEIMRNRYVVNEIIDIDNVTYDSEKNIMKKSNENKSNDTNDNKINNGHIDNDNLNDNRNSSDDDIDTLDINDNRNDNKPIIIKKNETQISGIQPSAFRSQNFLKSDSNFLFNVPKGIYIRYPLPESVMYLHKKDNDDNEILNGQLPLEFHVAQK
jgi:hypothetical protein